MHLQRNLQKEFWPLKIKTNVIEGFSSCLQSQSSQQGCTYGDAFPGKTSTPKDLFAAGEAGCWQTGGPQRSAAAAQLKKY